MGRGVGNRKPGFGYVGHDQGRQQRQKGSAAMLARSGHRIMAVMCDTNAGVGIRHRALLGFAALLKDAPPREPLQAAIAADARDLRARHLLGVRLLVEGESEAGLQQFLEMLRLDKAYEDGLAKKALIDAFRIIEDEDLVGAYRRKMASLLF